MCFGHVRFTCAETVAVSEEKEDTCTYAPPPPPQIQQKYAVCTLELGIKFLSSVVLGSTERTYKDIIKIDVKELDTDWVHVGRKKLLV
jgi:hypothetical protein